MKLSTILLFCLVWGAIAGALMGAFPGNRVAEAFGSGLLAASGGAALLGAAMGLNGLVLGFILFALGGTVLVWIRPLESPPVSVGGVAGAVFVAIFMGIFAVIMGGILAMVGRLLRGRPSS